MIRFTGFFTPAYEAEFVRPALREVMASLGTYRLHVCDRLKPVDAAALARALAETDVALTGWPTPLFPAPLPPGCPLAYVCHLAGRVGHFLPRRLLEDGLRVTNWGEAGVWNFAEGGLALILGCVKSMHRIGPHMQDGKNWEFAFDLPAPTLRDKTVGFVGYGAIARTLTEMLRPLRCRFRVFDPHARDLPPDAARSDTLDDLFASSDIVTVQCGLTPATTGMIGLAQLRRLRPHAVFVNTARGLVVREEELIAFLRERPDVIAGLDVYAAEPLPADSPLRRLPNVISYPHCVGSCGTMMGDLLSGIAAANIRRCHAGQPLEYLITPEKFDLMT